MKITTEEYAELIRTKRDFELIRNAIFNAATDSYYSDDSLRFDSDKLNNVIALVFPSEYRAKVNTINQRKAEENE